MAVGAARLRSASINCLRCTQFAILYEKHGERRGWLVVVWWCMLDACAMIRTHTRAHPSRFSLCARSLSVDNRAAFLPPLDAYSNRFVYAVAADRTPQATENSLKILDIYSYNLHVITLERRVCVRALLASTRGEIVQSANKFE